MADQDRAMEALREIRAKAQERLTPAQGYTAPLSLLRGDTEAFCAIMATCDRVLAAGSEGEAFTQQDVDALREVPFEGGGFMEVGAAIRLHALATRLAARLAASDNRENEHAE